MSARRRESWEFVDRTVFWLLRRGLCSLASSYILRGSRNSTHNFVKCGELRHFNQDQLRSLTLSTFFPLRLRLPAAVRRRRAWRLHHRHSLPPAAGGPKSKMKVRRGGFPCGPLPAVRWPLLHTHTTGVVKGFAERVAGVPRRTHELSLAACCHPLPLGLRELTPSLPREQNKEVGSTWVVDVLVILHPLLPCRHAL